jgi:hypothetical protein
MNTAYLLDTSVFRFLPRQILEALHLKGYNLYASPFVFWELLTHLHEEGGFVGYKARMMKFRFVDILDDPRALIESSVITNDTSAQQRVPDTELIEATLAALEASNSLESFYATLIEDSKGRTRQVADCAARSKEVLAGEEQRFVAFLQSILEVLASGRVAYKTDSERHQAVLDLLEGQGIYLRRRGAGVADLRDWIIDNAYIHWACVFRLALKYFAARDAKPDMNDYEDARICLHLRLSGPFCLVTEDRTLRSVLQQIIDFLGTLNDSHFRCSLQVIDGNSLHQLCTSAV